MYIYCHDVGHICFYIHDGKVSTLHCPVVFGMDLRDEEIIFARVVIALVE